MLRFMKSWPLHIMSWFHYRPKWFW